MDYEKKHQEDLRAAKGWLAIAKENNNKIAIQILENLFPELKESEDEKIRKEIIKLVNFFYGSSSTYKHLISADDMIAWLEKQGKKSNYNPYKATVESISAMVEKYSNDGDLEDFYNNVAVKCHDAIEYEKTWGKQGEQKPAWNGEDEAGFGNALWAIEQARSIAKDENDMGNLWYAERWLKSIKERMKGE